VVIVNESFVRRFLPDQKTIGRRFGSAGLTEEEPWLTIVGVVPDLWMGGVDNQDQPPDGFYRPYTQTGSRFLWIPASVPGDPTAQVGTLWAEVAALGPESPLDDTQSLDDTLRADLNLQYTMGGLFGVFGLVALLLTALGLHGSVEFVTNRHTREIGVRVPLDAGSSRVIRMVIGQTSGYVVLGVLAGLGLGEFVSRSLGLFIVQEQSWDLSLHRGIILVLCAGTLTASLIPALMATRIPPSEALRWEYGKGPLNHGRDP
jgi:predicted lysophospholipase L1 biosynthesis ABC-type transport system permease subunit